MRKGVILTVARLEGVRDNLMLTLVFPLGEKVNSLGWKPLVGVDTSTFFDGNFQVLKNPTHDWIKLCVYWCPFNLILGQDGNGSWTIVSQPTKIINTKHLILM